MESSVSEERKNEEFHEIKSDFCSSAETKDVSCRIDLRRPKLVNRLFRAELMDVQVDDLNSTRTNIKKNDQIDEIEDHLDRNSENCRHFDSVPILEVSSECKNLQPGHEVDKELSTDSTRVRLQSGLNFCDERIKSINYKRESEDSLFCQIKLDVEADMNDSTVKNLIQKSKSKVANEDKQTSDEIITGSGSPHFESMVDSKCIADKDNCLLSNHQQEFETLGSNDSSKVQLDSVHCNSSPLLKCNDSDLKNMYKVIPSVSPEVDGRKSLNQSNENFSETFIQEKDLRDENKLNVNIPKSSIKLKDDEKLTSDPYKSSKINHDLSEQVEDVDNSHEGDKVVQCARKDTSESCCIEQNSNLDGYNHLMSNSYSSNEIDSSDLYIYKPILHNNINLIPENITDKTFGSCILKDENHSDKKYECTDENTKQTDIMDNTLELSDGNAPDVANEKSKIYGSIVDEAFEKCFLEDGFELNENRADVSLKDVEMKVLNNALEDMAIAMNQNESLTNIDGAFISEVDQSVNKLSVSSSSSENLLDARPEESINPKFIEDETMELSINNFKIKFAKYNNVKSEVNANSKNIKDVLNAQLLNFKKIESANGKINTENDCQKLNTTSENNSEQSNINKNLVDLLDDEEKNYISINLNKEVKNSSPSPSDDSEVQKEINVSDIPETLDPLSIAMAELDDTFLAPVFDEDNSALPLADVEDSNVTETIENIVKKSVAIDHDDEPDGIHQAKEKCSILPIMAEDDVGTVPDFPPTKPKRTRRAPCRFRAGYEGKDDKSHESHRKKESNKDENVSHSSPENEESKMDEEEIYDSKITTILSDYNAKLIRAKNFKLMKSLRMTAREIKDQGCWTPEKLDNFPPFPTSLFLKVYNKAAKDPSLEKCKRPSSMEISLYDLMNCHFYSVYENQKTCYEFVIKCTAYGRGRLFDHCGYSYIRAPITYVQTKVHDVNSNKKKRKRSHVTDGLWRCTHADCRMFVYLEDTIAIPSRPDHSHKPAPEDFVYTIFRRHVIDTIMKDKECVIMDAVRNALDTLNIPITVISKNMKLKLISFLRNNKIKYEGTFNLLRMQGSLASEEQSSKNPHDDEIIVEEIPQTKEMLEKAEKKAKSLRKKEIQNATKMIERLMGDDPNIDDHEIIDLSSDDDSDEKEEVDEEIEKCDDVISINTSNENATIEKSIEKLASKNGGDCTAEDPDQNACDSTATEMNSFENCGIDDLESKINESTELEGTPMQTNTLHNSRLASDESGNTGVELIGKRMSDDKKLDPIEISNAFGLDEFITIDKEELLGEVENDISIVDNDIDGADRSSTDHPVEKPIENSLLLKDSLTAPVVNQSIHDDQTLETIFGKKHEECIATDESKFKSSDISIKSIGIAFKNPDFANKVYELPSIVADYIANQTLKNDSVINSHNVSSGDPHESIPPNKSSIILNDMCEVEALRNVGTIGTSEAGLNLKDKNSMHNVDFETPVTMSPSNLIENKSLKNDTSLNSHLNEVSRKKNIPRCTKSTNRVGKGVDNIDVLKSSTKNILKQMTSKSPAYNDISLNEIGSSTTNSPVMDDLCVSKVSDLNIQNCIAPISPQPNDQGYVESDVNELLAANEVRADTNFCPQITSVFNKSIENHMPSIISHKNNLKRLSNADCDWESEIDDVNANCKLKKSRIKESINLIGSDSTTQSRRNALHEIFDHFDDDKQTDLKKSVEIKHIDMGESEHSESLLKNDFKEEVKGFETDLNHCILIRCISNLLSAMPCSSIKDSGKINEVTDDKNSKELEKATKKPMISVRTDILNEAAMLNMEESERNKITSLMDPIVKSEEGFQGFTPKKLKYKKRKCPFLTTSRKKPKRKKLIKKIFQEGPTFSPVPSACSSPSLDFSTPIKELPRYLRKFENRDDSLVVTRQRIESSGTTIEIKALLFSSEVLSWAFNDTALSFNNKSKHFLQKLKLNSRKQSSAQNDQNFCEHHPVDIGPLFPFSMPSQESDLNLDQSEDTLISLPQHLSNISPIAKKPALINSIRFTQQTVPFHSKPLLWAFQNTQLGPFPPVVPPAKWPVLKKADELSSLFPFACPESYAQYESLLFGFLEPHIPKHLLGDGVTPPRLSHYILKEYESCRSNLVQILALSTIMHYSDEFFTIARDNKSEKRNVDSSKNLLHNIVLSSMRPLVISEANRFAKVIRKTRRKILEPMYSLDNTIIPALIKSEIDMRLSLFGDMQKLEDAVCKDANNALFIRDTKKGYGDSL